MNNGTDIYDRVFATDHEAGLKIMMHLYKKATGARAEDERRSSSCPERSGRPVRRGPGEGAGVEERAVLGPDIAALVVNTARSPLRTGHVVPCAAVKFPAGESGYRARPMDPAWVEDIRDQCVSRRTWRSSSSSGAAGRRRPTAAELHWETMCALAAFRKGKTKAEQWILWSPAMIVKGASDRGKVDSGRAL